MTSTHAWIVVAFTGLTFIINVIIISRRVVSSDQIDKLVTKELLESTRELLEEKIGGLGERLSDKIDTLESNISEIRNHIAHPAPRENIYKRDQDYYNDESQKRSADR